MSTTNRATAPSANGAPADRSYFEQQRDELFGEIAQSLEHVLQNINRLNRGLESVIAVGNEFGSVEALWSQFEGVMADGSGAGTAGQQQEEGETTAGVGDER